MSTDVETDLQVRLAQLEAENSALRSRLTAQPGSGPEHSSPGGGRGRRWTVLATSLIVLGCLLAPVGVLGGWARSSLTDTDAFVRTYAPLARTPEIQDFVVDQAAATVDESLDVDQLTSDVIDNIRALGTRPAAGAALEALRAPATRAIQDSIRDAISAFVHSDQFAVTWERTLRVSHTQLVATMRNDPLAVVAAQSDGSIGVQLGPIIADVRANLMARGLSIADRIPAVERTIPIARASQLPGIQQAYQTVVAVGSWLPWVALLLLTAGVLVARRRMVALLWAAGGLAASMALLLMGLAVGRSLLLAQSLPVPVPGSVTASLYDTATAAVRNAALSALVVAVAIAVVGWAAGPFRAPRRLRALVDDSLAVGRRNAEAHGVTTGSLGTWVHAQRRLLHVLIAVAGGAAIVLLRPLSLADIAWTAGLALLAVLVVGVVERPPTTVPAVPRPGTAPA